MLTNVTPFIVILGLLPFYASAGFEVKGSLVYKYTAQKGETYSTVVKIVASG